MTRVCSARLSAGGCPPARLRAGRPPRAAQRAAPAGRVAHAQSTQIAPIWTVCVAIGYESSAAQNGGYSAPEPRPPVTSRDNRTPPRGHPHPASRVRSWERNGSGEALAGAVRRGDRQPGNVCDQRRRRLAADSLASALSSGRRGRRFKSGHPDPGHRPLASFAGGLLMPYRHKYRNACEPSCLPGRLIAWRVFASETPV
jgi:hypothetical protein